MLIRHVGTGRFIGHSSQQWVNSRDQAHNFVRTVDAVAAALHLPSDGAVELLLDFGDPQYDVPLPVYLQKAER